MKITDNKVNNSEIIITDSPVLGVESIKNLQMLEF